MNTIVVTGATSMIGIALIQSAISHDVSRIYAVVRPNSEKLYRLPKDARISIIECSAENYSTLPSIIHEKCDVFYHFAWSLTGAYRNSNPLEQSKNISYTLDALYTAKKLGCKKFIGAGSQAEYGNLDIDKISPDSPTNPTQSYGIAKLAAGNLSLQLSAQLDISCLWVRIFSVYGIYDKPTSMITSTIQKLLNQISPSFTPAEQKWDYLYSSDAGEAFYLIGMLSFGRKIYCLGSGETRPLKEYINAIGSIVDSSIELQIGSLPYPQNAVMNLCADISLLQKDTGFSPRVSFKEGIRNTAAWLMNKRNEEQ